MSEITKNTFLNTIVELLKQSQQDVLRTVNSTIVYTYFEIGRMIVEEEQNGKERAEYGKQLLKLLSNHLSNEFGKGFSIDNLENMRKFYLSFSINKSNHITSNPISETLSRKLENNKSETLSRISEIQTIRQFKLPWSHYVFLTSIDNNLERNFYEIEASKNNWSVRELKRQYNSGLFTRLSLSKDKEGVLKLAKEGQVIEKPSDLIKDPYILEFLGLPELQKYSENDLEEKLISKLEDENKTIGLILCQNKSDFVVKYTLPEDNNQIFASKYQTVLPTKEELEKYILK